MSLSRFNRFDDRVEIGPIAGFELGVQQFAVGADLEGSACGRNKSERRDAFSKFKNFGRQTDGLRRVVSDYAVFDRNFSFHRDLLSGVTLSGAGKTVKIRWAVGRRSQIAATGWNLCRAGAGAISSTIRLSSRASEDGEGPHLRSLRHPNDVRARNHNGPESDGR
jgi:hypothetical protein